MNVDEPDNIDFKQDFRGGVVLYGQTCKRARWHRIGPKPDYCESPTEADARRRWRETERKLRTN